MKKIILMMLCALTLMLSCPMTTVSAAGENSGVTTTSAQSEQADENSSRGRDIAVFLIIFTVAMGTTAFIVARPKLKKLREVRSESDNTNQTD